MNKPSMYLSLSQLSHVVGLFLDRCEQASVYPRTLTNPKCIYGSGFP